MTLAIEDFTVGKLFAWDQGDTDAAMRMRRYRQGATYAERKAERAAEQDWRSGASGKSGHKPTLLELPICAIDGEGETHPNGTHHYIEFCAVWQGGRHRIRSASLSTAECFEFLLALPPGHVYV